MKRTAWVLSILWHSLLNAGSLQIDHVTIAGRDLHAMEKALAAVGLRAEYGGPHANHATEMSLVSFPDGSYLELIAIQPNADPEAVKQHHWSRYLESNAGPCAWAVRSADVDAEVRRLRAAGVEVKPPSRSGRARPDGYRLDWQTAQVGVDGNGTFFPFLIRDFTPREKRAFPSGKPTTTEYAGIAHVVISVRDLDQAIARYRTAFDLPEPTRKENQASFEGTPVILAEDHSIEQRISAIILRKKDAGGQVSWFDTDKLGWRLGVE